jgi:hypothetical protein
MNIIAYISIQYLKYLINSILLITDGKFLFLFSFIIIFYFRKKIKASRF